MDLITRLKKNLAASIAAKQEFATDTGRQAIFARNVKAVIARYRDGRRIDIAGNGGLVTNAQHLAAEFVSKLARDHAPLSAEALTTDTSVPTAIGYDYSFDLVFSRQLADKVRSKDLFLAITTSRQSPNILKALEQRRAAGIPSVVFCGRNGGKAAANGRLLHRGAGCGDQHDPGAAHGIVRTRFTNRLTQQFSAGNY